MKKKIMVIVFLLTVLIIMLQIQVNAVDTTFKVKINESKSTVSAGEEISFTLALSEINIGASIGTNAITATIQYNDKELEYLDYETVNKWNMTSLNENNMTFAVTNNKYVTENQEFVKFKFKVKSDINASKATINLKNISAGFRISEDDVTNTNTIKAEDSSKTIQIIKNEHKEENTISENNTISESNVIKEENTVKNENVTTNDVNNQNTVEENESIVKEENQVNIQIEEKIENIVNEQNKNQTTDSENRSISTSNKNSTMANKTLPKTGFKNILILIICLFIITIIAGIITYKKYKKID